MQNRLPHLRKAAGAAVEWRGALPMVIHALESHEQWSAAELQRWLAQHTGSCGESDSALAKEDAEQGLRQQVMMMCQRSLQQLLGPENPSAPLMTPARSSVGSLSN